MESQAGRVINQYRFSVASRNINTFYHQGPREVYHVRAASHVSHPNDILNLYKVNLLETGAIPVTDREGP
jgi:hypothetical protein